MNEVCSVVGWKGRFSSQRTLSPSEYLFCPDIMFFLMSVCLMSRQTTEGATFKRQGDVAIR
ncbi:hypothetical protein SK128_022786, partial [Halocaridina rubra]